MQLTFTVGLPLLYLNKHKKVILSSSFAQKQSSYYNPQANKIGYSSQNRMHHYKELAVRTLIGSTIGYAAGWRLYGRRVQELEPEIARNPEL